MRLTLFPVDAAQVFPDSLGRCGDIFDYATWLIVSIGVNLLGCRQSLSPGA